MHVQQQANLSRVDEEPGVWAKQVWHVRLFAAVGLLAVTILQLLSTEAQLNYCVKPLCQLPACVC